MAELMKGKVWADRKHLIQYPVIAEVKYDEIRVHVKRRFNGSGVEFLSYAGNPLHNLESFVDTFLEFFAQSGLTELDCGVEVNGNFNDSYRWVRSSSGIPKEKLDKKTGKTAPALDTSMVRWILFDMPDYGHLHYSDRRYLRHSAVARLSGAYKLPISSPESFVCDNEFEVDTYFTAVRERGFEGLVVKTPQHTYEKGKRIDGWLKMKPEDTADGRITAINQAVAADGTLHERAGSVTVVLEDGSTASPAGLEWGLASAMWERPHEYIGQWCEFKYMEIDRAGGYRHPSFVRLREAK